MAGLLEILTSLKTNYPNLRVELTIDVGANLSRKLNAREIDIAILSDPISAPYVVDEPIGKVDLQWVASTHMPLHNLDNLHRGKDELTPSDMASQPIVVTPSPSTLHQVAAAWFRHGECEFENFSTCNSMMLITKLVAAGHAIALLPVSVVREEIHAGIIRVLPVKPAMTPRIYYVSYLREEQKVSGGILVRMARDILMQSGLLMPL